MDRKGPGHIGALLEVFKTFGQFLSKVLAAFDRDRIAADFDTPPMR